MASVYFSRHAERDLKRIPVGAFVALRKEHVPCLAANPRTGKALHGPLRGYFSYEFGSEGVSYRMAYGLVRGDVVILMVAPRDNFYKQFSRRIRS